jgi:hypothetical protein
MQEIQDSQEIGWRALVVRRLVVPVRSGRVIFGDGRLSPSASGRGPDWQLRSGSSAEFAATLATRNSQVCMALQSLHHGHRRRDSDVPGCKVVRLTCGVLPGYLQTDACTGQASIKAQGMRFHWRRHMSLCCREGAAKAAHRSCNQGCLPVGSRGSTVPSQ